MSAAELPLWTAAERESFFAAIARHRRAAWQVSAVAGVCIAILAFVVATLTAPLFYALIGLLLDVINLFVPMPDLLGAMLETLGDVSDHMETLPASRWLYLAIVAALPGLVAVVVVLLTLRRIVREAEASGVQELALRAPSPSVLTEQRLANVVAEMAIAANIKMPKVAIIDTPSVNAAVFGPDDESVTVLVSTGLLEKLNREQMQAVAGHLIGLIANGDVVQGMRVAQTLSLFGFVARLSDGIVDPPAWTRLWQTLREALQQGASSADSRLILELINPFGQTKARPSGGDTSNKLTWREWIRMPLYGPLVISGFFGGMVSNFFLEPLLALIWRRRKYLADAIAVQLTRDPQALSHALGELGNGSSFPAWCSHMLIAGGAHRGGLLSGSSVPMYPAHDKRLKALARMGATVVLSPPRRTPLWLQMVIAAAGVVVVALMSVATYLLVMVSIALSGLFTLFPTVILHALLR
ncbi:M48 family metalloprotease [Steroidobacter cummioxidans]|uniref:M48 family metalloprotease n=1 Tax=Steroidobacter cummioxidans TaxID=1803913 RepID=UPI000E31AA42|nr:M48 family metalloprotease [Steroidobacter cummioxidans]